MTIVHKGNIMKFTEGGFRDWGYELAKREFGAVEIDGGPWCKIPEGKPGAGLVIKDAIADITLQQVLTRPTDFDVIATLNLNGDYLSDALAAQVGGIGIAPGGNINYVTGHAIFEATHGTAPKYANKDVAPVTHLHVGDRRVLAAVRLARQGDGVAEAETLRSGLAERPAAGLWARGVRLPRGARHAASAAPGGLAPASDGPPAGPPLPARRRAGAASGR